MPKYLIRYQKRTRQLHEVAMLRVEYTPWSEWSEHEITVDFFGKIDKRLAASYLRAKLNDDAGRGHNKRLQVRITGLEEQDQAA